MNPTPRQLQILRYVHGFTEYRRYAPTYREIGEALGISAVSVSEHVHKLKQRGMVTFTKHMDRDLTITKKGIKELGSATSESSCCPTCGRTLTDRTNGTGRTPHARHITAKT